MCAYALARLPLNVCTENCTVSECVRVRGGCCMLPACLSTVCLFRLKKTTGVLGYGRRRIAAAAATCNRRRGLVASRRPGLGWLGPRRHRRAGLANENVACMLPVFTFDLLLLLPSYKKDELCRKPPPAPPPRPRGFFQEEQR